MAVHSLVVPGGTEHQVYIHKTQMVINDTYVVGGLSGCLGAIITSNSGWVMMVHDSASPYLSTRQAILAFMNEHGNDIGYNLTVKKMCYRDSAAQKLWLREKGIHFNDDDIERLDEVGANEGRTIHYTHGVLLPDDNIHHDRNVGNPSPVTPAPGGPINFPVEVVRQEANTCHVCAGRIEWSIKETFRTWSLSNKHHCKVCGNTCHESCGQHASKEGRNHYYEQIRNGAPIGDTKFVCFVCSPRFSNGPPTWI